MPPDAAAQNKYAHLAHDILEGADAIAEFLFLGTSDEQRGRNRRKIYYLAESSRLPVFRLGSLLCARKSVLLDFIAAQENRVLGPNQ
ncbi:DNA-binding protein [Bradyrhizobium sp. CCGUVB1N3]|uniref:DNA-binding protein n=1 Tax=Bradyrhizobium sp. CCGUVB1N3 TaxID=2949629 RepID=UPI0020B2E03F|nr:DNA-binding protein [Bradyrhizobium sp. CCGUVB1N3]MCP3476510.1 DNA-binding protein [Bradyrhizobium sp. CCGUVB1N3]